MIGHRVTDWRLRPVTIADFSFIFRVYRTTMKSYIEQIWDWNETAQRQHYERSFSVDDYQIIQVADEEVGVLSMQSHAEYDFLARIEILPVYQNQGIGTAILGHLIQQARKRRTPIMLRVFKINPARHLYERLGFQIIRQDAVHYDMLYATVDT
ncbi:MAG: GNAT family N-acetyltransferase [Anaerolineae bacterium]